MSKKKQSKKVGVSDPAKDVKAYVMECNLQLGGDPYAELSLEGLEKAFDLAGARITYAQHQELHWRAEAHKRMQEFNQVTVAYKKRKHGFTDEQIKNNPQTSTAVWSYAK